LGIRYAARLADLAADDEVLPLGTILNHRALSVSKFFGSRGSNG
jgi:hypothetical protein